MTVLQNLAELYGGLVGKFEDSVEEVDWEKEVRMLVKGKEDRFIPRGCYLNWDGVDFPVRFVPEGEEVVPAKKLQLVRIKDKSSP